MQKKVARRSPPKVLLQVKVSHRAAAALRARARADLRTLASYLRAVLYRDLSLAEDA